MSRKIESIEKEKYTEYQLDDLAQDIYGDEEVIVLGMPMQSLRILKELDECAYFELLEGLQEEITMYICPECGEEHEEESDAEECCLSKYIAELEEKRDEFILNESWIDENESPSWGDVAEANAEAESKWDETEEGKELKRLKE